jgi:hypothetical protein
MRNYKFLFTVSLVGLAFGGSLSAKAEILMTGSSSTTAGAFACSATDLVNSDQSTLTSATRDKTSLFHAVDAVNNGVIDKPGSYYQISMLPVVYTFTLDTGTNTRNTLGYTITEIDCFAGYHDPNVNQSLGNQNILVEVQKVGSTAWLSVGAYTFEPFDKTVNGASSTKLSLTNVGGSALTTDSLTLTGVDAVRITYLDNGSSGVYANGVIIQEIDVIGTATVPEPSTAIMGVLGAGSLLTYAWRKRKNQKIGGL